MLIAACVSIEARAPAVDGRIADFLVAIRDRAGSLGWDQLRSDVRASYPGGRPAWLEAIERIDTSPLTWRIANVSVDDYVGCAEVDFGASREFVPPTLFDEQLPAAARVASPIGDGRFWICATVGPLPFDAGIHGVG